MNSIGRPLCTICKSKSEPKFQAGIHLMYQCTSCKGSFVWPIPENTFLDEFYSTFHSQNKEDDTYDIWESRMSLDFKSKFLNIKNYASDKSKLLDVGCGKGYFVKFCIDQGVHAEGIDLSDTAIQFARKQLGIVAHSGRVENKEELINEYDIVSFWATIEHLPDPISTLKAIRKTLKPKGYLFLDTGIGNDWFDKLLPGVNQWYDPPQHLHVFSKQSLMTALDIAGFQVVSMDTNFDRTIIRRIIRFLRALFFGFGQRILSIIFRTEVKNNFQFTRFPMGNLISITAKVKS